MDVTDPFRMLCVYHDEVDSVKYIFFGLDRFVICHPSIKPIGKEEQKYYHRLVPSMKRLTTGKRGCNSLLLLPVVFDPCLREIKGIMYHAGGQLKTDQSKPIQK